MHIGSRAHKHPKPSASKATSYTALSDACYTRINHCFLEMSCLHYSRQIIHFLTPLFRKLVAIQISTLVTYCLFTEGVWYGYRLDGRESIPDRERFFSSLCAQNGSGAHPPSYPMRTRDAFPGVKRPGPDADHSPPSSVGQERWSYYSTHVFMA
jgi:hypothetical protein